MCHARTPDPPFTRRPRRFMLLALLLGAALVQACVNDENPVQEPVSNESTLGLTVHTGEIGDVLPGTDLVAFEEAEEAFSELESISDGLGPTFNEAGCGACHTTPVVGGSGVQIERRFGRFDQGVFYGYDDDARGNEGGTLRQLFSNGTYTSNGQVCNIPVEVEPDDAQIRNVGRRTQPLFGLGLVDAMPDAFFEQLAREQPVSIRGVVQSVTVVLPDPRDNSQFIGSKRVGRFGWKAQVPGLLTFSGDAYVNEMGISTQSCFRGRTILAFAEEGYPNGNQPPEGCNGGDLAPAQPAHPDVPRYTDDAVGPCTNGKTEIQDDLILFTTFMERLAPPPRDLSAGIEVIRLGEENFERVGCAGCHVSKTFVTPVRPFNGVPGRYAFRPFSDFLAHDMGSLGDQIGNTGDSVARTRLMRTQPLWGARFNTSFLHDGRAPTVRDAILGHDGQGAAAREAFLGLTAGEQEALVKYVLSL
jgi:CxxC motif-containing protein (DUF1111 family)